MHIFGKMGNSAFACATILFASLVADVPAGATETIYTLDTTNPGIGNFWGPLYVSGTVTYESGGVIKYDITAQELYTYVFTTSFTEPSQFPPTLCILAGSTCNTIPPSPAFFSIFLSPSTDFFSAGLTDDLRDYSATGTLTVSMIVPETSTWATMLLGFAGLGLVGYRKAKKSRATL